MCYLSLSYYISCWFTSDFNKFNYELFGLLIPRTCALRKDFAEAAHIPQRRDGEGKKVIYYRLNNGQIQTIIHLGEARWTKTRGSLNFSYKKENRV